MNATKLSHSIFFLIRIVGGESTRHVGHWMAYCTCPEWLWWWRIWWNEDWQGKPKYSERTYSSATLSTTNPTWQIRARTRAAAVGSQRLTAWAMARPWVIPESYRILLHRGQHTILQASSRLKWTFEEKAVSVRMLVKFHLRNYWVDFKEVWY
jgi:hypothetical protein